MIDNGSDACLTMLASSGVSAKPFLAGIPFLKRFDILVKPVSQRRCGEIYRFTCRFVNLAT
jgi:hypothetical protein